MLDGEPLASGPKSSSWTNVVCLFSFRALFHLGAGLPVGHLGRESLTRALLAYGVVYPLGKRLAEALEQGITKQKSLDLLRPNRLERCTEIESFIMKVDECQESYVVG